MIVTPISGGSRVVTQADHARFAADLLRLFRLAELVEHPRRDLLLRAVAEHDNGWWEADAAPRLAADGGSALDFRSFPADLRQEIWQRGVERYAAESPYLAALLATHALRLSEGPLHDPSWPGFRAALVVRSGELLDAAGEKPETLAGDDPWLALGDGLSLAVCTGSPAFVDRTGWRLAIRDLPEAAPGAATIEVRLAPFPFAGGTVFELSCRTLAAARIESGPTLAVALAASPWQRLRVRFLPL